MEAIFIGRGTCSWAWRRRSRHRRPFQCRAAFE